MLPQKVLVSGSKGLLLVVLDSTQVWWIRTRLKFGGLGLDSSIFKRTRTRLESINGWTRSNTAYGSPHSNAEKVSKSDRIQSRKST